MALVKLGKSADGVKPKLGKDLEPGIYISVELETILIVAAKGKAVGFSINEYDSPQIAVTGGWLSDQFVPLNCEVTISLTAEDAKMG